MRTAIFLLFVVALIFAISATEALKRRPVGRKFVVKKCIKQIKEKCTYKKRCSKTGFKCLAQKRMTHCKKWISENKVTRTAVCQKWAHIKNKCATTTRKVCLKTGWRNTVVKKARCAQYEHKTYCTKKQTVCLAHKVVKRCHIKAKKPKITGPKKCAKGHTLTFKKTGTTIRRSCKKNPAVPKKVTLKTCNIFNDPHVTLFGGKAHEFQKEGDYNFVETADGVFAVHLRFKRYNNYGWTGIVGAAVRVNGVDVVKLYAEKSKVELNGKAFAGVNGADTHFKNGGSIRTIDASKTEIFAPNGAKILVHFFPNPAMPLINVSVFVPSDDKTKGVCALTAGSDKPISGLFKNRMHVKNLPIAYKVRNLNDKKKEKNATIRCKALKLKGTALKNCVFDLMQVNNPKIRELVLKMEHAVKKDAKLGKNAHRVKLHKPRRVVKKAVRKVVKKVKKAVRKVKKAKKSVRKAKKALKKAIRSGSKKAIRKAKKALRKAVRKVQKAKKAVKVAKRRF